MSFYSAILSPSFDVLFYIIMFILLLFIVVIIAFTIKYFLFF